MLSSVQPTLYLVLHYKLTGPIASSVRYRVSKLGDASTPSSTPSSVIFSSLRLPSYVFTNSKLCLSALK